MSAHPNHIADWIEQLADAGARFCTDMDPMDAVLVALLARRIERAASDYLAKFNLKGVIHGKEKTR